MNSIFFLVLFLSAKLGHQCHFGPRRYEIQRSSPPRQRSVRHGKYYKKVWVTKNWVWSASQSGRSHWGRARRLFSASLSTMFKVDDMLLMKWQYHDQSPRRNNQRQSQYFFRSGSYWNRNWDSTQSKFMIPFQKHPDNDAHVSSLILWYKLMI